MTSDFAAARIHLERACHYLRGEDETSRNARLILDSLIEEIAVAQFTIPKTGKVLDFPPVGRSSSAR